MLRAVSLRDSQQLLLRIVAILALPESVRPFSKKRRRPRQLAVRRDNRVELRPIKKIIIHRVRHFRTQIESVRKPVVEPAARPVVPENSVSIARQQKRRRNIRIVLRNVHRLASVIPHSRLVLSQPVERLLRVPHARKPLRMQRFFSIHFHWRQRPRVFLRQPPARRIIKNDRALRPAHFDLLFRRLQRHVLAVPRVHSKLRLRPALFHHDKVSSTRHAPLQRVPHPYNPLLAHLQSQKPRLQHQQHSVRLRLNTHHRIQRQPLRPRRPRRHHHKNNQAHHQRQTEQHQFNSCFSAHEGKSPFSVIVYANPRTTTARDSVTPLPTCQSSSPAYPNVHSVCTPATIIQMSC